MCQNLIQSLFGGGQQPTTPAPVATGVTREKRAAGQVKDTTPDAKDPTTGNVSTGGVSIGSPIGQPDGVRKRTTELGL